MKQIEDYIKSRKKNDGINEFDDNYLENLKIITSYVADYFIELKSETNIENMTILEKERFSKFEKSLAQHYSVETTNWLVNVYLRYDQKLNTVLMKYVKKNPILYFISDDVDMKQYTHQVIKDMIKKYPYLYDMDQQLSLFFKEVCQRKFKMGRQSIHSEYIRNFTNQIWMTKKVNIEQAIFEYIFYYSDAEYLWPDISKVTYQSASYVSYQLKLSRSNPLGINELFSQKPVEKLFKGNKQVLEYLLIHCWVTEIDGDDQLWQDYLNKISINAPELLE